MELDRETLRPVLETVLAIEDPLQRAAFTGSADLLLGLERDLAKFAEDLGQPEDLVRKAYAAGKSVGESVVAVAGGVLEAMQVPADASADQLLAAMGLGAVEGEAAAPQ